MSEEQSQENGTANGEVPEIELIIKVGLKFVDAFSIILHTYMFPNSTSMTGLCRIIQNYIYNNFVYNIRTLLHYCQQNIK